MLDLRRFGWQMLFAALAAPAWGCGASGAGAEGLGEPGAGGTAGTGGSSATTLAFEDPALTLLPSEVREVVVRASPAGVHTVDFALLGGDIADASLDRSSASTDADGRASVRVTAPSRAAAFTLRASIGSLASSELTVSVSAAGFATLQVVPSYAGTRSVSVWTASVRTGTSCAALVGAPPEDGDLRADSVVGQTPRLEGVPVGPVLAVSLRAGHYAFGCTDLDALSAEKLNTVTVAVVDVPLRIDETSLEVALGIDAASGGWQPAVASTTEVALGAMLAGAPDDVSALLDAMKLATPIAADEELFAAARAQGAWDAALGGSLNGGSASNALRDRVRSWMLAGAEALAQEDTLRGRLVSAGKSGGWALFELDEVAGAPPAESGFVPETLFAWTADPGDTVHLGGTLHFLPTRLLAALAEAPGASSVPDALAELLSCASVAATITSYGDAYAGCAAACVEALCHGALETLWQRARDASGTSAPPAALEVTAAGAAGVDDEARPVGFEGSWVGGWDDGVAPPHPLSGTASGWTPAPQ